MKKEFYFFVITIMLVLNSCNDNPLIDDDKPGRRDYTWAVDTMRVPEGRSYPSWMWGADANNVWAIGSGYLNAYQIWHYNGIKWENYEPDKYIDPCGICGFSSNNIWTSSLGTSSLPAAFWHYNGTEWSKFCDITIQGYYNVVIQGIAGSSQNNVYAVGFADSIDGQSYKAIIFHFDGNTWKQVSIPNIRNSFAQIFYDGDSGKFIIYGWTFDTIIQYVYSFDGKNIKNIFSNEEGISLSTISNNIYATINQKLYKYGNEEFSLFKDFSNSNYVGRTIGRSEKDFFTINWNGIGHYNGTDLITIYEKWNDNWFPDGGIVFEKDIFFIWDDSFNTFVVHGKLND